jgi:adenine-specific DNA-methyltransferase
MNNYNQLKEVLNDIFELNKADLDFGIYRIINQKRKQVNEFIEKQLPEDIKQALSETQTADKTEIENDIKTLKKNLDDAGIVAEDSPKYKLLKERLQGLENSDVLEQEVFSHLANFFRRYYKDGDFISMRRYKKDVYAIPYEGEEVKLHWANHDQYYIKSSENFKNYSFKTPDGKKVTFQLKEVSTEQNNNKSQGDAERKFAIHKDQPVEEINGELYINFIYEPFSKSVKQEALITAALELLTDNIPSNYTTVFSLSPTEKNTKRTLLEKHFNDYVSKNSFDYFIHKDLGGFLSRELDFFIKNEVLYIDDINAKQTDFFVAQLSKVKAIKTVAEKVITFLSQIENFQKKLWLKKKFVVRTDYCITLDKIPDSYFSEILSNKAQLEEWKALFNIDIQNAEQLVLEQFLVLDTKFFEEAFKDRLLVEFDNLDEQVNGLLINSENFQALNLMQEKFQECVQQIYIDPPYNTGNDDGFAYKDNFQKSSWLSLMFDRLKISNSFLRLSGTFSMSIDIKELDTSLNLLNDLFGEENRRNNIAVKRSAISGPKVINPGVVNISENILLYSKNLNNWLEYKQFKQRARDDRYSTFIENIEEHYENWRYISLLEAFSKHLNIDKNKLKKELGDSYEIKLEEFVVNKAENIVRYANLDEGSVSKAATDLKNKSKQQPEKTFLLERQGKENYLINNGNVLLFYKNRLIKIGDKYVPGEPLSDIWDDVLPNDLHNEGGVYLRKGKKPEKLVDRVFTIGSIKNDYIMDYFGGSGTSGAVALKSNKKFLVIEQGGYFNSITLNRIKNTLFGDKSGVSKIYNWKGGGIVKYQVLESYEDTLNNLYLQTKSELDFSGKAKEEYLLQYMLEMESSDHLFNLQMFRKPFNYQLKVTENNELKPIRVDLVETFNYLIGLYVSKMQRVKDIKVVEGTTRTGIKTLVIWRDLDTTTHDEVEKLLRRFYDSQRTKDFQQIYINGDHHLENLRSEGDLFKIKLIEETFFKKMFNESEL